MDTGPEVRADRFGILASGGVLLLAALLALTREVSPAWKGEQERVVSWVEQRLGPEQAARVQAGLQQIWVEPLDRVDRCITCHTTIEWGPELADAPHPARSHPRPELLAAHPPERFGCTICHGGQGFATEDERASRIGILPRRHGGGQRIEL